MRTPIRVMIRSFVTLSATAAFVLAATGSAAAATPASWPDPEPTTALRELLLYGGGLLGLMVGLTLLSLVLHRNNYVPPEPSDEVEKASEHHPTTR